MDNTTDDVEGTHALDWSPKQSEALSAGDRWMRDPSAPQVMRLFGFAGTGKTTLAKHLADPTRWRFASYTGKAAHVMRQKGCDGATTIHSLIYRPAGESRSSEIALLTQRVEQLERKEHALLLSPREADELKMRRDQLAKATSDNQPRFQLWANSPLADPSVDGIVIDECSMIDERLGRDLESFGKKILVLGDPAQLPPVGAGGYFTNHEPDVMLTEIHRHARESGILRLATEIREGKSIHTWARRGAEPEIREWENAGCADVIVRSRGQFDSQDLQTRVLSADQVLVGRNLTRKSANRRHRALLGRDGVAPMPGDRLVCLRNDRELGLFNGAQFTVSEASCDVDSRTAEMKIVDEDGRQLAVSSWLHHMIGANHDEQRALEKELTDMGPRRRDMAEFDYAYALTCHKSQGSQWPDVLVFDESQAFGQDVGRRWLYTAVTRASEKLTVIL